MLEKVGLHRRIFLVSMLFILLMILFPDIAKGAERWERWKDYDIRTKPNAEFTAELVDDVFATLGKGGVLEGKGKVIVEAGEKNGISPAILTSMIALESSWGKSTNAKNNNNTGGIKCRKDYECSNGYTKFPSVDESIRVQAELLSSYYVGQGMTSIQKMLETYAPPSDGNSLYGSGGYIDNIGSVMEVRLKQDSGKGELLSGSGGSYTEGGDGGGKVGDASKGFFMESQYVKNASSGVDSGDNALPQELSYSAMVFSKKVHGYMVIVGVLMSAALILYMSLILLFYVALVKGISYKQEQFEKLMVMDRGKGKRYEDIHSRKAIFGLIGRMFIGVLLIGIFMSGYYIEMMAFLYIKIEQVINLFF